MQQEPGHIVLESLTYSLLTSRTLHFVITILVFPFLNHHWTSPFSAYTYSKSKYKFESVNAYFYLCCFLVFEGFGPLTSCPQTDTWFWSEEGTPLLAAYLEIAEWIQTEKLRKVDTFRLVIPQLHVASNHGSSYTIWKLCVCLLDVFAMSS